MPELRHFGKFERDGMTIALAVYEPENLRGDTFRVRGVTREGDTKTVNAKFSLVNPGGIHNLNQINKTTLVELEQLEIE